MGSSKITSINVRNLAGQDKWDQVLQTLKRIEADIIFPQECGLASQRSRALLAKCWPYGLVMCSGSGDNKAVGVAVLLKGDRVRPLQHKEIVAVRLLQATLESQGTVFEVLAVYVSANRETQDPFLERLAITMPTGCPVMLVGDFNCIISEEKSVSGGRGMGMDRSSRQLKQLVCNHGLVDTAKDAQGHFTQVDPVGKTKSRIDFVFPPMGWKAEKARCTPMCFSDHSPFHCLG